MPLLRKIPLSHGWHFKQSTTLNNSCASSSFLPVAGFPTVAHLDLLHHKLIPDPDLDNNELDCLWVNDADWTYRTQDIESVDIQPHEKAVLVFQGLDTIVDVFLNGEHMLYANNMHIEHQVDVTNLVRGRNEASTLELRFRNAPGYGRKEWERIGYKGTGVDPYVVIGPAAERCFVRKAQYHWGWDWGPALNTCGPWRPIYLEVYTSRITGFLVRQETESDLQTATVSVKGMVQGAAAEGDTVTVSLIAPDGESVSQTLVAVSSSQAFECAILVHHPRLWYPFQYGAQPLYTVRASLLDHDVQETKIGFRRLRLLQHELQGTEGKAFVFEVNNIRVFCGGSNWIPGDMLLPRFTRQRYEDWLLLAKSGNQCMIRVWGGGVVEDDSFYDICDREGLLVWQDFPFACGNYPGGNAPDFIQSVKVEAEALLRRVGHHPSLAIWAGNNEDYMYAELLGWEIDYSDEIGPWDATNFPAREIYEKVLPEACRQFGGDVPYWRGSPYAGKSANDGIVGDAHVWQVWHMKMAPYQDYKKFTSRFASEFGIESAPDIRTLHRAVQDPKERHWQSRTLELHDKGLGHERRYGMYMSENFRFRMHPLKDFVYCTQFLQAEAISYAYNIWRREFRGPGREYCAGALVWQLNDIWPGISWALVDVDGHRKPSFYVTKRALATFAVGMERIITAKPNYLLRSMLPTKAKAEIWAVNGELEARETKLELRAFDIGTGKELPLSLYGKEMSFTLQPNQSTELLTLDIPSPDTTVVVAYLRHDHVSGGLLARWVSWPEPLKYVRFSTASSVDCRVEGEEVVVLRSKTPLKGVVVSVPEEEGDNAVFEDNFVDLVPGEEVRIGVKGLAGRKIETRWLCDWETEPELHA